MVRAVTVLCHQSSGQALEMAANLDRLKNVFDGRALNEVSATFALPDDSLALEQSQGEANRCSGNPVRLAQLGFGESLARVVSAQHHVPANSGGYFGIDRFHALIDIKWDPKVKKMAKNAAQLAESTCHGIPCVSGIRKSTQGCGQDSLAWDPKAARRVAIQSFGRKQ